jgi:hypothetical protein
MKINAHQWNSMRKRPVKEIGVKKHQEPLDRLIPRGSGVQKHFLIKHSHTSRGVQIALPSCTALFVASNELLQSRRFDSCDHPPHIFTFPQSLSRQESLDIAGKHNSA